MPLTFTEDISLNVLGVVLVTFELAAHDFEGHIQRLGGGFRAVFQLCTKKHYMTNDPCIPLPRLSQQD